MSGIEKGAFHINANKSTSVSFIDNDGNTYKGTVKLNSQTPIMPYQFIKGKMLYANGDDYDGEWEHNKNNVNRKSGKGTMFYANDDIYYGEWRYDHRFGKGMMIYANNENYLEYHGKWEYDIPTGYGTLTYKDEKQITGFFNFENNKFIINVDNSNANIKKLSDQQLMAIPLEDEYIYQADVVYTCPDYEEPVSQDVYISNTEIGNTVEVRGKVKAKGGLAKIKRYIGPYFGFPSAGFIE